MFFSHNKSVNNTFNYGLSASQPAVFFSNIKSASTTSHLSANSIFSLTTNQHQPLAIGHQPAEQALKGECSVYLLVVCSSHYPNAFEHQDFLN
jgi:hypothetical protein